MSPCNFIYNACLVNCHALKRAYILKLWNLRKMYTHKWMSYILRYIFRLCYPINYNKSLIIKTEKNLQTQRGRAKWSDRYFELILSLDQLFPLNWAPCFINNTWTKSRERVLAHEICILESIYYGVHCSSFWLNVANLP